MMHSGAPRSGPSGTGQSPLQCPAPGSAPTPLPPVAAGARAASALLQLLRFFMRTLADLVKAADFPELKEFFAIL